MPRASRQLRSGMIASKLAARRWRADRVLVGPRRAEMTRLLTKCGLFGQTRQSSGLPLSLLSRHGSSRFLAVPQTENAALKGPDLCHKKTLCGTQQPNGSPFPKRPSEMFPAMAAGRSVHSPKESALKGIRASNLLSPDTFDVELHLSSHQVEGFIEVVILHWLAEYMANNDMDLNVKDGYGNTALHLAAKHGHAMSIKALVMHQCDVSLKNDLGYKASDYAILYSQVACSEFLLCLEACLLLSSDVVSLDSDLSSSKNESSELKIHFKDVLSCAKKLVKEREEVVQHLDKLQDGLVQINNAVMSAIQTLSDDNSNLQEQSSSGNNCSSTFQTLNEAHTVLRGLLTTNSQLTQPKGQDGQRQRWLSPSSLSEMQQKILLAEEKWKRARARVNWGDKEAKDHMTVFRDSLTQVQTWATGIHLSDIRSISSSESSLASMEDAMSDYDEHYETILTHHKSVSVAEKGCSNNNNGLNCWECHRQPPLPPPASSKSHVATLSPLSDRDRGIPAAVSCVKKECVLCPSRTPPCKPESSPLSKTVNHSKSVQQHRCPSNGLSTKTSGLPAKHFGAENHHAESGQSSGVQVPPRGTCKVLEVIVSSTKDLKPEQDRCKSKVPDDGTPDGHHHHVKQSSAPNDGDPSSSKLPANNSNAVPFRKTKVGSSIGGDCKSDAFMSESRNDKGGDDDDSKTLKNYMDYLTKNGGNGSHLLIREAQVSGGNPLGNRLDGGQKKGTTRSKDLQGGHVDGESRPSESATAPPLPADNHSCAVPNNVGKLAFAEPDLIIGIKGIRDHSSDLPEGCCTSNLQSNAHGADGSYGGMEEEATHEEAELFLIPEDDGANSIPLLVQENEPGSLLHLAEKASTAMDFACMSTAMTNSDCVGIKRRGFLQKLNIRWPAKIKVKNPKRVQEITPEDFRETYLHTRNGTADDVSVVFGECANEPVDQDPKSVSQGSDSVGAPAISEAVETIEDVGCGTTEARDLFPKVSSKIASAAADVSASQKTEASEACASLTLSMVNVDLTSSSVHENVFHIQPLTRNVPIPPLPTDVDDSIGPEVVTLRPLHSSASDSQDGFRFGTSHFPSMNQNMAVGPLNPSSVANSTFLECSDEQSLVSHENSKPEADQIAGLEDDLRLMNGESTSARPQACAAPPSLASESKTDPSCLSRPESSASRVDTYSAFRYPGFPLHKASSVSTDLLTRDSLTPSRLSPSPSEASKTESALSPPSDISKTESVAQMKHLVRAKEVVVDRDHRPFVALPVKQGADVKTAAIVDIGLDSPKILFQGRGDEKKANVVMGLVNKSCGGQEETENSKENPDNKLVLVPPPDCSESRNSPKEEKPWYELSDDEEILMPETLNRNLELAKNRFEEEDLYCCS